MLVDWGSEICGIRMLEIRNLLERLAQRRFSCGDLSCHLRITNNEATVLLTALLASELVEMGPSDDDGKIVGQFSVTATGRRLAASRAVPRISRSKAEMLLGQFLDRVQSVNSNDEFAFCVDEVRIFGSYLDPDADHLGDIDLAAHIVLRRVAGRDASLYRRERERFLNRRTANAAWDEVATVLKARSPYISLTCISTIELLSAQSRLVFKANLANDPI
jgi:hypothetical protein